MTPSGAKSARLSLPTTDYVAKAGARIELLDQNVLITPIPDATNLTAGIIAKTQRDISRLVMKPVLDFCQNSHADLA
jgi:hypothetical protein